MMTAVSADGTALAYDRFGDGPPIIMAAGAFNTRAATEPLARSLAAQFTVLNYDRRAAATAVTPRRTPSSARSKTSPR
jgi:hypothetical protein